MRALGYGSEHDAPGRRPRRAVFALAVAGVHGLLGYGFLSGMNVRVVSAVRERLTVVELLPLPPQPEKKVPPPPRKLAPNKGASAPPNLKAVPKEITAPPPLVQPPLLSPPVIAPPVPALGTAPTAGASDLPGPGTGGGGEGDGYGAGSGEGEGGTHSRWLSGRIKRSDYPRAALEAGEQGTVVMRVVVGPKGRVTDCSVTKSSGSPVLDAATCRLVMKRYRYEPGRDASGRPTYDDWVEEQTWTIYQHEEGEADPG